MLEETHRSVPGHDGELEKETPDSASVAPEEKMAKTPPLSDYRRKVVEFVYGVDSRYKSLTGRTPERLEEETGISKEELLPSGKDIIYVGDPWQRLGTELDNEHVFIIDYEYGESAEFITSKDLFFDKMLSKESESDENRRELGLSERILEEIKELLELDDLSDKQRQWLEDFQKLVQKANRITHEISIDKLKQYERAATAWQKVREYIEDTYRQEMNEAEEELPNSPGDPGNKSGKLADFRREAWYASVYAQRGFCDIPDWFSKIKPVLDEYRLNLAKEGKSQSEIEALVNIKRKILIDNIRLRKKPEKAHVVEAVFPELPFEDESFDRLVASWSISVHVFPYLGKEEFKACWKEIARVLKSGGKAYIFPLDYYRDLDETAFCESLDEVCRDLGMKWKIRDGSEESDGGEERHIWETLELVKN